MVVYPDSGKVGATAAAFGETLFHITRLADAKDCYDGEDTPA